MAEINYVYEGKVNELQENVKEVIYDKLDNFYKQVDRITEEGEVEYCEGEVIWIFEYDKYRVMAKKINNEIDTKVWEKIETVKVEWKEMKLDIDAIFI